MSIESEIARTVAAAVAPLAEQQAATNAILARLDQPVPMIAMKRKTAAAALDMTVETLNKLIAAGAVVAVTLPTGSEVIPAWSLAELVGDPSVVRPSLEAVEGLAS